MFGIAFIRPWRYSFRQPKVVTIEGLIGAGKSELLKVLRDELSRRRIPTTVIDEPVESWKEPAPDGTPGILERFYGDQKRWGYHFQTKAFLDRCTAIRDALAKPEVGEIVLMERCPHTDKIFMELLHEDGQIDELEWKHYQQWWSFWTDVVPVVPDVVLYLRPPVDCAMNRIKLRGRKGEEGIPREYQAHLEAKHDEYYGGKTVKMGNKTVKVVHLDTTQDFRADPSAARQEVVNAFFRAVA